MTYDNKNFDAKKDLKFDRKHMLFDEKPGKFIILHIELNISLL